MRRSALYYVLVLAAAAVFLAVWLGRDEKLAAWSERYIAKSHAAQKAAHAREYVAVWLPRAALINLGICALLLAGGPWLARREAAPAAETMPQEPSLTAQRLLWVVTAGAVLSSALLNYPRLSQSLWGDEENTMRRSVLGEYNAGPDGALAWSAVEWGGSVWNYRDPNNHPCFSVLAKLSHALWPPADDPAGWYFHEAGLRLPAYLFGLAGLAALALLAQAVRMPGAGVLAVVWLALHPWHVRYGVDARGYALLFVWIPLSMLSLWRAAHGGRWIWWICYGVLEFLILWSYPGAVYFLLALNLSALALLLRKGLPPAWRAMGLKRWVVANAVGAMLTVQLMLPLVPPMLLYLQRSRIRGQLTADWLTDSASQMLSGIHFWDPGKLTVGESWARLGQERPWLMASVFGVVLIALLLGVFRFWRQGSGHRSLLWVLLLPAPFMVL
ncbi:MAG: hypothetical protein KA004_17015, partial [Verrucomicrobiales bacterium]|nr:hypothetical protein [Verrucomicrobiales bacterium]